MTTGALPASIQLYDTEREYLDPDLDFPYIDEAARDAAYFLADEAPVEVNYQPGDGTRYALVLVPLRSLFSARPRVKDGTSWGRHSIDGMGHRPAVAPADYYDPNGYLVTWVANASYPFRLGGRDGHLAASYVTEHMKTTMTSGCSIALLLRSISYHLDA